MKGEKTQTKYKIKPLETFPKNTLKSYENGDVLTTFPSVQFHVSSSRQLYSLMKAGFKFGTEQVSGITIPLKNAVRIHSALMKGKYKEQKSSFTNNKTIAYDPETEYWYRSNQGTIDRKKAFSSLEEKPSGWTRLYRTPSKSKKHMSYKEKIRDYENRLRSFFSEDKNLTKLTMAFMRFSKSLDASIFLPPAPMVIGTGVSLEYCLKVNRIFNKYRGIHGVPKSVYYPLHPRALDSNYILSQIKDQVFELKPKLVTIGTIKGQKYLPPDVDYKERNSRFENFTEDIGLYSRTNPNSIVTWYDKGHYSSPYGYKLIKRGFDSFICPLTSNYYEGGGRGGPKYGSTLHGYKYYDWKEYLKLSEGVPCEKECCAEYNRRDLEEMSPHQQWKYKRMHEIGTKNAQFRRLISKLRNEGSLKDFDVRLKRNKID